MNLKTILRNFLNHFETLEERRKCPNDDDDLYAVEFQSLKELTESLKRDNFYACKHGLKDVNRRKNRYKDILPYDYSRVILSEYPGVPGSDYINANFVRGSTGSACAYVASQGPLPNTVVDFWRMIWECEIRVIVMACNETESGKYKCEMYWPLVSDQEQQYGNITAQQIDWRQVCPDFLVRTFRVTCDNKERIVCQFHYTTWPDHGVPTTVGPILELVRLMRDVQATEATPILVHCSAGCGRTGTICSIDYVWALLRTGKLKEDFSLYKIIHEMRRQRIAMVQTQEQYILCYRAVAALFEQQLKVIDAHTYENLDEDGEPYHKFAEEENSATANSSSDEESSSDISEAEIHYRVQRSATFPSKDMKQLVDSWKSKKMTTTPSTELPLHPSDSMMYNENQSSNDNKQEKLIGKATVIRRPSIAKFKAMFGSMELAHHQLRSHHSQSHPHHLHNPSHLRSLERLRFNETASTNGNNNNNNNSNSNYCQNNFTSRFQDSDCADSVATSDQEGEPDCEPPSCYQINANPLCEPKKPFTYLTPDQLKAFTARPPCSPSPPPPPTLIGDSNNHESNSPDDEIDGQPTYESPADILRHQHHTMLQRSLDDGMINVLNKHRSSLMREEMPPPPKPPRTYQYGTKGNTIFLMNGRTLTSPMNSNNSGRIIVSVAQRVRPRIHIPDEDRPKFADSKSHNDLYSASTYSNLPAFSYLQRQPPPLPPLPTQLSQLNQYYSYPSSGNHQLDKSSQEGSNQPIYERLKHNSGLQASINGHDLPNRSLFRPPIPRMPLPQSNKMFSRGGPPPPFITAPRNLEPNRFGNLTVRREPAGHNILNHQNSPMQLRNHGVFPGLNGHSMNHTVAARPRSPNQLTKCNETKSNNESVFQSQNKINLMHNNQMKSNGKHNASCIPRSVIPVPATSTPGIAKVNDKSNEIVRTNDKKKATKTNSKSDFKTVKDTNPGNHETKKHSFSFSSTFFPFRKTTKAKGTTSPSQQSVPQSNPQGNPSIRPPHSHRFSPPTQWTQV